MAAADANADRGGKTKAEAPVTRAEFERLVTIVREVADELAHHTHRYNSPDSTYGEQTYGPDSDLLNGLWRRLDTLFDSEPEPSEDDDGA